MQSQQEPNTNNIAADLEPHLPQNESSGNRSNQARLADEYLSKKRADQYYDWKRPIEFFGRVVDQSGRPLPGASVEASWTNLSENGTGRTNILTDADGAFTIKGINGKTLGIRVTMAGFSPFKSNQNGFEYADPSMPYFHQPNPKAPEIFRMYKHAPQKLLAGTKKLPLTHDGGNCTVELGSETEGNLAHFIVRSWTNERTVEKPDPDWRVELEMNGAEIQEAREEFPFEAPDSGYTRVLNWQTESSNPNWTADFEKQIFFKTISGNYGRVHIKFLTWGRTATIEYWINPSGSRELDPGQNKFAY